MAADGTASPEMVVDRADAPPSAPGTPSTPATPDTSTPTCPPPYEGWFRDYDGSFVYDTPAEKRFVFPRSAGDTMLTGSLSYDGCTYDEDGTITGTFTVTPQRPEVALR